MSSSKHPDKFLLFLVIILISLGLFIFFSASLGLLARDGARFGSVLSSQIGLGLIIGGIWSFIVSTIDYKFWGRKSFWVFLLAICLTLAVFIPGVGFSHGGAKRWLSIGNYWTLQPAEFLKIAYIIYLATWIASVKNKVSSFKYGFLPFVVITLIPVGILLAQPDTGTVLLIGFTGLVMYFTAGGNLKHIFLIVLLGLILGAGLIFTRPYLMDRVKTFINPASDSLGSGYQIRQSLIAIGSGGISGKGFGQSVQKFKYLPEPIGDSIFAVAGEEFGFWGTTLLVILFSLFIIRGVQLSYLVQDTFGGLLMLGLVIIIGAQSFFNMGAMLGIFPLSGLPLIFISHGGTALFFSLFAIGIMLNISRHLKRNNK